jgi:predicted permease
VSHVAERLFGLALLLLPRRLRARARDEMLEVFRDRVGEAKPARRPLVALAEIGGVLATAVRARHADRWTRATVPTSSRHPDESTVPQFPASPRTTMEQTLGDIRFAIRTFARRPLMLGIAALSLALGIGASAAMFSVVDAVLLRPLPFDRPDRLVSVYPSWPELRGHPTMSQFADRGTFSWAEVWDIRDNQTSFESIGAYDYWPATVLGDGPPERLEIGLVTPSLFRVLRVSPTLGTPLSDDPGAGEARQIVLSDAMWRSRYGAQASVIGTSITLDDVPYTIVGVMPPHTGVGTRQPQAWVARSSRPSDAEGRGNHSGLAMIARLEDGVSVEQARDEVARILRTSSPPDHGKHEASVYPLQADRTHTVRPALVMLLAAAGLLLAVGCANVAAILLGTGLERRHEIALRGALGASRGRLARQLLTESMVLAAVGGAGGVVIAVLATRALLLLAPADLPRIAEVSVDFRALAFAILVSAVSGIIFGLFPSLSLARQRPAAALGSSRGSIGTRGKAQSMVVVGELALATVLLVGGALLVRTLVALNHIDPGFRANELLVVRLAPPFQRFRQLGDSADRVVDGYFQRIVDEVASVPGVRAVAVTQNAPLTSDRGNNEVEPEGWRAPNGSAGLLAERRFVSVDYFRTLGIRLVAGRPFGAEDDRADAPPAMIISEGLAKRVWPNESAVGKRIKFWGREPQSIVVGVAADVNDEEIEQPTQFAYYVPLRQMGPQVGRIMVRTDRDPATLIPVIRERVWKADPAIAIPGIEPYRTLIAAQVSEERYRARLMVVFAALAAVFAAMGVYGVTARSVARRTREIGIRVALGAEPRAVLSGVLMEGFRLAALGVAIGLVAAIPLARSVERLLFGVRPSDPVTLGMIGVIVCMFSVAAALPPGRRAVGVSPMTALRSD